MNARAIGIVLLLGALAAPAAAQAPRPFRMVETALDSGLQSGSGEEVVQVPLGEVEVGGSPWMRLVFGEETRLGEASYIVLHSSANGDEQRLDAKSLAEWSRTSGVFVGDKVTATLHLSPIDRDVRVRVKATQAGVGPPAVVETLCGSDNRAASSDNRVGRLFQGGCTAFRIANGSFMTAGHCADFDPDQGGPGLPDGVLDLAGVVEFNVPPSTFGGNTVPAPLNDQYPILAASVTWRYDGAGQGAGKDWCVFRVGRNANTNLLPHQAYGVPFRVTRELPTTLELARVTGFGTDTAEDNCTNQTSTGLFLGQTSANPTDIYLSYQVDTMPANSGSPVIWPAQNLVFGVHTTGGCNSDGSGSNTGTSYEVDQLEVAMNDNPSSGTEYVDNGHPLPVTPNGGLYRPWPTIVQGANAVPTGRLLSIFAGTYSVPAGTVINRSMTFAAPAGAVVIH
jgi:hypothetical protein